MILRVLFITVLFVATVQCSTQKVEVTGITYTDQNNNRFFISSEIIRYQPITAIESSSGTYDGGEKKFVSISHQTFISLVRIAKEIASDTASHSDQRRMTTSVISIKNKTSSNEDVINEPARRFTLNRSALRTQLEQQLRALID